MMYIIDNKFYVKIGAKYCGVDAEYTNDDINFKPNGIEIEDTPELEVKAFNLMDEKEDLIKKHNNKNKEKSFKYDL